MSSDRRSSPDKNVTSTSEPKPPAVRIVGRCEANVWGLTPAERLKRFFAQNGLTDLHCDKRPAPESGTLILARGDCVFEDSILRNLIASPGVFLAAGSNTGYERRRLVAAHVGAHRGAEATSLLASRRLDPGAKEVAGLRIVDAAELATRYNPKLRRRNDPYVMSVPETPLGDVERRMFEAVYKRFPDLVTKWIWPRPARFLTRCAVRWGIAPNFVTVLGLTLVLVVMGLFATGNFLAGLVVAWIVALLDTVDGKLARLTLTSTELGNVLDHGADAVYPPLWYACWWYGVRSSLSPDVGETWLDVALGIIIAGYLLDWLNEGIFQWVFHMEIHVWRPVDSVFRIFTARRNANLALLTIGTISLGPYAAFATVAAWALAALLFHYERIVHALWWRLRGREPRCWLAEPDTADPS